MKWFFLLIAFFAFTSNSNAEWVLLHQNDDSEAIMGIRFIDDNLEFYYGYSNGEVNITNDYGSTWSALIEPLPNSMILNITPKGDYEIIINRLDLNMARSELFLYNVETNKLDTIIQTVNVGLFGLSLINESDWISSGLSFTSGASILYKVDNHGANWTRKFLSYDVVPNIVNNAFISVKSLGEDVVVGLSIFGIFSYSFDNGDTWDYKLIDSNYEFEKMFAYDSSLIIIFGMKENGSLNGCLLKTTDFGDTWTSILPSENHISNNSLHYKNENEFYLVSNKIERGYLYFTDNQGETWKEIFATPAY